MVGLLNVGLSGFVLGRRPEYYWLWQTVKCVALNWVSYVIKVTLNPKP